MSRALHVGLIEAAKPVKDDAERLSRSQIRRMTANPRSPAPWSVTRIGVTTHEVYIVPRQRGVKSRTDRRLRRPNLAELMLGRSFEPALERNEQTVRLIVDRVLSAAVGSVD